MLANSLKLHKNEKLLFHLVIQASILILLDCCINSGYDIYSKPY